MKYTCKTYTNGTLLFSLFAINQKEDEQVAFTPVYCEIKLQVQNSVYSPNNKWKFACFVTRLVFLSLSPGL